MDKELEKLLAMVEELKWRIDKFPIEKEMITEIESSTRRIIEKRNFVEEVVNHYNKDKVSIIMECPTCKGDDVDYSEYPDIISDKRIQLRSHCNRCGTKWIEIYEIKEVTIKKWGEV